MRRAAVLLVAVAGMTAACSTGSGPREAADDRTLQVLAAASLTEVFDTLAEDFEADHAGVTVVPVYGSSSTLAAQVQEGAPADVLATADLESMRTVVEAGRATGSTPFATNRLVLVTPPDDPGGIGAFRDLSRTGVTFVACVGTAPCGKLSAHLLEANDVTNEPRSYEVDVKAVLAKVTSGEADAGLVYATDAQAADDAVRTIPVPGSARTPTSYAIAVVEQARSPALARDWVDLVRSARGREVLADAGFGPVA